MNDIHVRAVYSLVYAPYYIILFDITRPKGIFDEYIIIRIGIMRPSSSHICIAARCGLTTNERQNPYRVEKRF